MTENHPTRTPDVNWKAAVASLGVVVSAAWIALLNTPMSASRLPPSSFELAMSFALLVSGLVVLGTRTSTRATWPLVSVLAGSVVAGAAYVALVLAEDLASWFQGLGFAAFWSIGMAASAFLGVFIPRQGGVQEDRLMETLINCAMAAAIFSTGFSLTVGINL